MHTSVFDELASEKKERIINAGIDEFAEHGYINASTNRIVKASGISKGSLFQYFPSKEDLYFYILDSITSEFVAYLNDKMDSFSNDLFQRIIEYSEMEFAWYIQNPGKCKIIVGAFTKNGGMYEKIEARYGLAGDDIYYRLLEYVDTQGLRWPHEKTANTLRWFLKGFNEDFMNRDHVRGGAEIDVLRDEYVRCLAEYIDALKQGLLR